MAIYQTGCVDAFAQLVTKGQNNVYIIGCVSGFVLAQVVNAAIAFFVAMEVNSEKKAFNRIKKEEKAAEKALKASTPKN